LWQFGEQLADDTQFSSQMKLIELASENIDPEQYLTMMYELAYTYRDNAAFEQSRRWYKKFLDKAPPDHVLRKTAETNLILVKTVAGDGAGAGGAASRAALATALASNGASGTPPCAQQ